MEEVKIEKSAAVEKRSIEEESNGSESKRQKVQEVLFVFLSVLFLEF